MGWSSSGPSTSDPGEPERRSSKVGDPHPTTSLPCLGRQLVGLTEKWPGRCQGGRPIDQAYQDPPSGVYYSPLAVIRGVHEPPQRRESDRGLESIGERVHGPELTSRGHKGVAFSPRKWHPKPPSYDCWLETLEVSISATSKTCPPSGDMEYTEAPNVSQPQGESR